MLIPVTFVAALVLVSQGTVQSLAAGLGPVATWTPIKTMGSVGGGFFNVNSSMPYENPTAASSFLQALLMAHDVIEKDPSIAVRVWAADVNVKQAWAEQVYENVPPPLINQWANPHYTYSLVKGGSFERRLAFLASYLFSERVIRQPVDVSGVMDVSVYLDAMKGRR